MKKVIIKNSSLKDFPKKLRKIIIEPEKRFLCSMRQTKSDEKTRSSVAETLTLRRPINGLHFRPPSRETQVEVG